MMKTRTSPGGRSVREYDLAKGRYDKIPMGTYQRLGILLKGGCEKYSIRNYEVDMPVDWFLESATRHLFNLDLITYCYDLFGNPGSTESENVLEEAFKKTLGSAHCDPSEPHTTSALFNVMAAIERFSRVRDLVLPLLNGQFSEDPEGEDWDAAYKKCSDIMEQGISCHIMKSQKASETSGICLIPKTALYQLSCVVTSEELLRGLIPDLKEHAEIFEETPRAIITMEAFDLIEAVQRKALNSAIDCAITASRDGELLERGECPTGTESLLQMLLYYCFIVDLSDAELRDLVISINKEMQG